MNDDSEQLLEKSELKRRGISPFVAKAIAKYPIPANAMVLDIPCGYGRHAKWLADFGHKIVAADIAIDRILSFTLPSETVSVGGCQGIILNAHDALPFPHEIFDVVLTIDFVSAAMLSRIASYIKFNGLFIYQTMSGRGQNWRELPPVGETLKILAPDFEILSYQVRPAGPSKSESETAHIVGRRTRGMLR